ncbi:MAG: hypothetical protein NTW61_02670 [Candidatus Melainabacteria bacterium]|nr:hypothetical protein [Candidatus Melainabacteria bacterium]
MTPPLNFSGVPQQPQAMPPYGINQPPQRMPQQPMMYQQFGVVPDSFQGQQPMMMSNAPMMRSGRANLALKNQQLQDQIDTLENQPLPAGGNPVGVGALAVGAAGATAVGASEVAYRWDLDKKLAHEHNGRESQLREPLTDPQIQTITDGVKQAKLQELQRQADVAFYNDKQTIKEAQKIVKGSANLKDAILTQIGNIETLKNEQQKALNAFELEQRAKAYGILNHGKTTDASGKILRVDDIAKEIALLEKTTPVIPAVPLTEVQKIESQIEAVEAQIKPKVDLLTEITDQRKSIRQNIVLKEIEALEKKAFQNHLLDWGFSERQKEARNNHGTSLTSSAEQQHYLDYLQEQVNQKTYLAEVNKGEKVKFGLDHLKSNTEYEDWKKGREAKQVDDLIREADKKTKIKLSELEGKGITLNNELAPLRVEHKRLVDIDEDYNNRNTPYQEYKSKMQKLDDLKLLQAEQHTPIKTKEMGEAQKKLTDLETIESKKLKVPEAALEKQGIKTQLDADIQQKISAKQATQPKGKVPDLFATDAEAKGFGKAWQNVDDLKAKGFTELAEHSKGAKGVGWKAGALVGVIGAGLTLQQFFAAGKAQEANAAKEAKLAQLRQQQADLGG